MMISLLLAPVLLFGAYSLHARASVRGCAAFLVALIALTVFEWVTFAVVT